MWTYQEDLGADKKQILNKWMSALKKDQANPDIYFSLAVHYHKENDLDKATRCLDKALKLSPDFEQALVLQYYLTKSPEARLSLLTAFMQTNWNTAVTYFLKGLLLHQAQQFNSAIECFRNAIKFYNIQKGKLRRTRLVPSVQLPIHENPFGIYGDSNAAICEVYLSECYCKIERWSDALKHFGRGIEELAKYQPPEAGQKPLS